MLARLAKNFNRLANNEELDDLEDFPQLTTMYLVKFARNDEVEHYNWKTRSWERWIVDWALDEAVLLRPKELDDKRPEKQPDWADVSSDCLAKVGSYTAEKEKESGGDNLYDQEI
eukprot:TRINITY_DN17584_c0_g1_i2.p1 TRINITY_DN17584_c0_g1~~TRINITY_DN17584_c0_g1_i2.p1  ORF type:complete len:115 (+),score=47.36 TRINITY_DN17584_c0_g1_i2:380-724(+)